MAFRDKIRTKSSLRSSHMITSTPILWDNKVRIYIYLKVEVDLQEERFSKVVKSGESEEWQLMLKLNQWVLPPINKRDRRYRLVARGRICLECRIKYSQIQMLNRCCRSPERVMQGQEWALQQMVEDYRGHFGKKAQFSATSRAEPPSQQDWPFHTTKELHKHWTWAKAWAHTSWEVLQTQTDSITNNMLKWPKRSTKILSNSPSNLWKFRPIRVNLEHMERIMWIRR